MKESKSRFDGLGDRMKLYEMREAGRRLMPGLPVIARLDGRTFHTFTKGMPRSFFMPMSLAMIETLSRLLSYISLFQTGRCTISPGRFVYEHHGRKNTPTTTSRISKSVTQALTARA